MLVVVRLLFVASSLGPGGLGVAVEDTGKICMLNACNPLAAAGALVGVAV